MTVWGVLATSAPGLGLLLRSFEARFEGWRWTIWELMWLSGATLILLFFSPQTSASNILYRRARRLCKATGDTPTMSASEIAAVAMSRRNLAVDVLVRPFALNFQEPVVFALNVYVGLIYTLLYVWFDSFLFAFLGIYHWREQLLGPSFLGLFVGAFIVMPPFFAYLYYVQEPKYNDKGELKPDERIPVAIVGALLVPICLFWFGWTSRSSVHWIVPDHRLKHHDVQRRRACLLSRLTLFNHIEVCSNPQNVVLNYLAGAYPTYAASVLAGNDVICSMFGAIFPFLVRRGLVSQPWCRLGDHPSRAPSRRVRAHSGPAVQVRRTNPDG